MSSRGRIADSDQAFKKHSPRATRILPTRYNSPPRPNLHLTAACTVDTTNKWRVGGITAADGGAPSPAAPPSATVMPATLHLLVPSSVVSTSKK